jgi:phage RecT family recombinase
MTKNNFQLLTQQIEKKKNELWQIKASYLNEQQEVYFKRALVNIFENEDMAKMASTTAGAKSIFLCISKALQMGLQIGGQIPQAYILKFFCKKSNCDQAVLAPTAEGYKFIALSDPAVIKSINVKVVHEGDDCKINAITGEIEHQIPVISDKREMVGIYGIITELDGRKHADYISKGEIEEIRDNWSKYPDSKAWTKSFEQMAIAKATKRFLKPYAALKEGLAMALSLDEVQPDIEQDQEIKNRVGSTLDKIIDTDIIDEKNTKKDSGEKPVKIFGKESSSDFPEM